MPSTLVATGDSANTYATVAQADSYFDDRTGADKWTGASDDDKVRALLVAAKRIDMEAFEGSPAATGQPLAWPRTGTYDRDGREFAADNVPAAVRFAQMEVALAAIENPRFFSDRGTEGFDAIASGTGADGSWPVNHGHKAQELPVSAKRYLAPLTRKKSAYLWVI